MDGKIHVELKVSIEGQTERYESSSNPYDGVEDAIAEALKRVILRCQVKYEMRRELLRLEDLPDKLTKE